VKNVNFNMKFLNMKIPTIFIIIFLFFSLLTEGVFAEDILYSSQGEQGVFLGNLNNLQVHDNQYLENITIPNTHQDLIAGDQYMTQFKSTSDGGYIIAGGNMVGSGRAITRLNSSFEIVWSKQYALTTDTLILDVEELSNGNFLAVGRNTRIISNGARTIILIIDSEGNFISSMIENTGTGNNYISVLKKLSNGNIIGSGYGAHSEIPIMFFDPEGNIIWQQKFLVGSSSGNNYVTNFFQLDEENILIGGQDDISGTSRYAYVAKLNIQTGSVVWAKAFTGGMYQDDIVHNIVADDSGIYVITRTKRYSQFGGIDILITKIDEDGNTIYSKVVGGTGDDVPSKSAMFLSNGELIISGWTTTNATDSNLFFLRINLATDNFEVKYFENSNGNDVIVNVIQIENGFMIGGLITEEMSTNREVFFQYINQDFLLGDCFNDFFGFSITNSSAVMTDTTSHTSPLNFTTLPEGIITSEITDIVFLCNTETYTTSGNYNIIISFNEKVDYLEGLYVHEEIPVSTSIRYSILDKSCSVKYIDSVGSTNNKIDLRQVDLTFPLEICLSIDFETNDMFVSPRLYSWEIRYVNKSELPQTGGNTNFMSVLLISLLILKIKKNLKINFRRF